MLFFFLFLFSFLVCPRTRLKALESGQPKMKTRMRRKRSCSWNPCQEPLRAWAKPGPEIWRLSVSISTQRLLNESRDVLSDKLLFLVPSDYLIELSNTNFTPALAHNPILFVCQGCYNKVPQTGDLTNRNFLTILFEIRVSAVLVSSETSLLSV